MSNLANLMRRVRWAVGDRPLEVPLSGSVTADATSITVPTTLTQSIKAGTRMCFTDETDELVVASAAADPETGQVTVYRGQEGTTPSAHENASVLIEPRFPNARLLDAITMVVENELWPEVWIPGEATLTWQGTSDYYAAPVPGIGDLRFAYQVSDGLVHQVPAAFLPPELTDAADWPDGAVLIARSAVVDSVPIVLALRLRPSLGTLTAEVEHLVVLGASAHLVMSEEFGFVGGDTVAVAARVQDGSRLRAGAVAWERFERARTKTFVRLQHQEQLLRSRLFGGGGLSG